MLPRRRWGRLLESLFGRPAGNARKRGQTFRRLQLESLEERRLLAATLSFSSQGVLSFVDSANGNNTLTLSVAADGTYTFSDTSNTITVDPANGNPFTSSMGGHVATGSGANVTSIGIDLGSGIGSLTLDAGGNTLAPVTATAGRATDVTTIASNLVDSGDLTITGFGAVQFGATGQTITVSTTGNQDYAGMAQMAANVILKSTGGVQFGSSAIGDLFGSTLSVSSATGSQFDGGLDDFTSVSISGPTQLGGDVSTTGGGQDYKGAVTLNASVTLDDSGGGDISFESKVDGQADGGQALTTQTDGTTTFGGTVGRTAPLSSLTVEGFSSNSAGVTVPGTSGMTSVDTTGSQDYHNPLTLDASEVLTSTGGGNITFHSTVDDQTAGTAALTVETDGTTTFDGYLGSNAALSALTVEGFTAAGNGLAEVNILRTLPPISVKTSGNQDYFNPLIYTTNTFLASTGSSGAITFHSTVNNQPSESEPLSIAADGTVTFDGIVGGSGLPSILSVHGFSKLEDGTTVLDIVAPAGTPTISADDQAYISPVVLAASANLFVSPATGNGVQFNNTVTSTPGNAFDLTATGAVTEFLGLVSGVGAMDITGVALIGPLATVRAASVSVSSYLQVQGTPGNPVIETTGPQSYGALHCLTSSLLASSGGGDITVTTGEIEGPVTIETDGTTTLAGGATGGPDSSVESLTVEGFSSPSAGSAAIGGGLVQSSGNQDYFNPVTLTADETFQSTGSGNITFHSTVDARSAGGQALMTETDGTTTFDGIVGGNFALKSLTVEGSSADAKGTTDLNATPDASVTTTGGQDYFNPVTLGVDQVLVSTGAGNITFHSTVDDATAGTASLTTETDGTTTFDGYVGSNAALSALTVEGFTVAADGQTDLNIPEVIPPTVTTTGDQDYFNPVILGAIQGLVSNAAGDITFHSTVDAQTAGSQFLSVVSDGTITFDGVVGGQSALGELTTGGFSSILTGTVDLNASAAAGSATVTTTDGLQFDEHVILTANQVLACTGTGEILFDSAIDAQSAGGESLTTECDNGTAFQGPVGGTTALSSLVSEGFSSNAADDTVIGPDSTAAVTTTGNQDYFNPVVLATLIATPTDIVLVSSGAGAITFHSTVDDGGIVSLNGLVTKTDGVTTFDGLVGGMRALKTLTVEGFTSAGSGTADLNATSAGTPTVTTTGDQDYFDPVTLTANQILASTTSGAITFHSTVDAQTAGGQTLTTQTDGTTSFDGVVGGNFALQSLTAEGFSANSNGTTDLNATSAGGAATVTTTGTQDYFNPVTLSADQVLVSTISGVGTPQAITFHSTVDAQTAGGQALTTKTDGITTFDGIVGGNSALKSLLDAGLSANDTGITEFDAVAVPAGAITVKTAGNQDYFNQILLSSDQTLASTAAGNITFHLTVDDQPTGSPAGLTTETDGMLTFDGAVGALDAVTALLVEGFSAPGNGFTELNGGEIFTKGFATDSGGNEYTQEYANPVTLVSATNSLTRAVGAGNGTIIFDGTVNGTLNQSLDVSSPTDTVKFAQPVGNKVGLTTLELTVGTGIVQPAGAFFNAFNLILAGSGTFNLGQAENLIGNFAASVNGSLSLKDESQLTIGTLKDVQTPATFTGVATNGNNLDLTLGNGVRINQVVNTGVTGAIDATIGANPFSPAIDVTVAANLFAQSATFDGTNSLNRIVFNIAPSTGTPILVIGKPHILPPDIGNELDLDLQAGLPGFQGAGSPAGTKLFATAPPPQFPLDGSGFYTFTNRAQLTYKNIGQLGQLQASAYSYLNSAGTPVIVVQETQGSVDANGNIVSGLSTTLLAPLNVLQPPNNPFIFSPSVNSPYAASPPSVQFAFVRGGSVPDLIIAGGAGELPVVTVIDGTALLAGSDPGLSNSIVSQFYAFSPNYLGGVSLATGNLTDRGMDDIVAGMANGGDQVRTFVDDRPDPRGAGRVFFDQIAGPLGSFDAFGGFGGGVRVAIAPATAAQRGVLFVASGPGMPGMVTTYDGPSGTALPGLSPAELFGAGYTGGISLAATSNFSGTGNDREVLVGMNTGGSALDLYSFNNNAWGFDGQIAEVFPPEVSGRTSTGPVDPESTMGIGSLAFGGSAGFFFVGSGSTQPLDMREYPYSQSNPGPGNSNNEVAGFPVPFVQGELQVSGVLTPTLADPPPDAVPTITSSAPSQTVVAPGGTATINFTASSVLYPDDLRVTATSSNQEVLPDADVLLAQTASGYTVALKPPAGTDGGTAAVSVVVTDPQDLTATASFNVVVDVAPSLGVSNPISTYTLPSAQILDLGSIIAGSATGNPLTYSATVYGDNPVYDLEQQYHFQGQGYLTTDVTAYVLTASTNNSYGNPYYLISPSGGLYAYDGSGSYAHTFANETPITNLGANTYIDPTLLLDAQPPVDYTSLYNLQQQYGFQGVGYMTAGTTAYVLQASSDNSFGNPYYLLRSDGAVFAYDGSGNYASSFATGQAIANFGASVYLDPSQLLDATAPPSLYPELYSLNQQYDLKELNASFYPGTLGNQAQWIYSPVPNQYGQNWYTLTLSADGTQAILRAWEGYQDSGVGAVIATLDPSVYSNPQWLTNATTPPALVATAGVNSAGELTVQLANPGYVGTFTVDLTASDGMLSTTQSFRVTTTDTAPTITVQQNGTTIPNGGSQTVTQPALPVTDTVTTSDADGNAVTTTASVSSYDPLFTLQQRYQFRGLGYFTAGATAYVLQAPTNNSYGNTYYLLSPSGGLYAYDGSGSYSHTFADGTAIASTGASVYADPTLLLNAQPAVDYTGLYNLMQQYQFQGVGYLSAGSTAYVLRATSNNSFGNLYYLLKPDGGLYAYDDSGSFAHTFANSANLVTTVDPGVYVNPSLLFNAKAAPALYPQLYQSEQQFDLQEVGGSFYTGLYGNAAKWLYSPIPNADGQHWYTLVLSADGTQALLYAWNGGNNSIPNGAQPVATLDPAAYADPTLLTNAKAPEAATGITASVSGGVLILNGPTSFAGTFQVTVSATDGILTSNQTFQVTATGAPPATTAVAPQTVSTSGSPLQVTLSATDAENDPVTYTAQAAGYSPAYNLQRVYGFTGVGYATVGGVSAYVLQSGVLGGVGGYYLLNSNGGVYAYDGSGSFAHTFANANNLITTLSPGVYATPTLLTQAQAPATPAVALSVSGNTLTINAAGVAAGTVFEVFVTASDGAETTRTGFLVTVTA